MTSLESYIKEFYKRATRGRIILFTVSLIFVLAGGFLILASLLNKSQNKTIRGMLIPGIFMIIPFLIPLIMSSIGIMKKESKWEPYRLVFERPGDIVWIYFITTELKLEGFHLMDKNGIAICDVNGKRHKLAVREPQLQILKSAIPGEYKKIPIGYTMELDGKYGSDPKTVL